MPANSTETSHDQNPWKFHGGEGDPFDEITSALIFLLITTSVLLNGKLLRTVIQLRRRKQNRSNPTLILILGLAVSDLLFSTMPMTLSAVTLANGRKFPTDNLLASILCNLVGIVFSVTVRVSIFIVLIISMTRMVAIQFPFQYHKITSPRVLYWTLGAVWVANLLVSVLPYLKGVTYKYLTHVALCNWSLHEVTQDMNMLIASHIFLIILPFALPGLAVLLLYLVILYGYIRLRYMSRVSGKARTTPQPERKLSKREQEQLSQRRGTYWEQLARRRGTYWRLINRAVEKRKESIKLDTKTRQLLISALATLILVWVFCLCYLCWWGLSLDFLLTYLNPPEKDGHEPSSYFMAKIGLDHTGYMKLIVISYVMILISATTNPIIHLAAVKKLRVTLSPKKRPPSNTLNLLR